MLDSLLSALGEAWWSYPLILLFCMFDAVIPALPSETAMITGGIIAADGSMSLVGIIVMAAVGAFLGDNLAYWIGRSAEDWARRWITRGERGRRGLRWAQDAVQRYGGSLIIAGRFIPGGRTATMIASGVLRFPYRQFLVFDAVGAVLWATMNTLIGYVGGRAFSENTWAAFALSFGIAILVAGAVEGARRLTRRLRPRPTRTG